MNPIISPLKPGDKNANVANLQDALQACLERSAIDANNPAERKQFAEMLKPEQAKQIYGDVTFKAVSTFQSEQHLPASGAVDQPTADALNKLLKEWGLLDPPSQPVVAPAAAIFTVHGQVKQLDSSPFAGATVVAVDQDLRGETTLGTALSDPSGHYQINYTPVQVARAENGSADLIVRVSSPTGAIIAASSILFNAPRDATIDVIVGTGAPGLISEYERLTTELTPLLVNVQPVGVPNPTLIDRLADLNSGDLDFLARETGEDRRSLQFLAAAAVLEKIAAVQKLTIAAAVFYGLAREGLPPDLVGLIRHTAQEQHNALAQAIQDNIVPAALSATLDQTIDTLQRLVGQHALQTPPVAGAHSLAELFNSTALSGDQQATLMSLAMNHAGSPEQFWNNLRQQPNFQPSGVVENLQFTIQLGLATQHHLPLIQALQKEFTAPRDLVKLDRAAWLKLINTPVNGQPIGVPPGVSGATPQEQAANYVDSIVATVRAAFPTDAVAQIAATIPDLPTQQAVTRFLANSPDFDIRTSHVDGYAASHAATAFDGIAPADQPQVVAQVKRLQRVFQLSTDGDTMSRLLDLNLDSAQTIASVPRKTFLARHAIALGGEQQAAQIYERAQFLHARSIQVYTTFNDALNGVQARALSDGAAQLRQDLVKRFPNYSELFGSLDLCNCDECRSVLSPAAYLVDLLEFLRNSTPNDAGQTPLDVLLARRPDLEYLPLTCENTNTPLPYVDLVNEVLESYIALGLKLNDSTAHDTGDTTAAELDANPQYTNDAAYQTLEQAAYPFTLPFNQPVAVARAFLENLGSSRYEVIQTMQKDQTAPTAVRGSAAEYLGITAEEYQILTGANFDPGVAFTPPALPFYYGYAANATGWEQDVTRVPEFLKRTGITYTDLVELVKTQFLNPNYPQGDALALFQKIPFSFATLAQLVANHFANPDQQVLNALQAAEIQLTDLTAWANANFQSVEKLIVLDAPEATCDLSETRLIHLDGTELTEAELSKLHRVIRLWRRLGWRIADVDRALTALEATDITPEVVTQLAAIKHLQDDLSLSNLQILLSLWATINTRGDDALYKKLFLSKAARQIDPVFQPNPDGSVLTDATVPLSDHIPTLLAALRVGAADLEAIRVDAGVADQTTPPVPAPLTLANVSALYRYAALAHALKLHVADLIALKALSGINPFAAPDQTILFETISAIVRQSGFKVAQLNYLYRHLAAPPASLTPPATTVLLLARTLRDGLAKIAQDHGLTSDPIADQARIRLAVLFDSSTVNQVMALINGTAIYSAPLTTLPDAIAKKDASNNVLGLDPAKLPVLVQNKISYDPKAAMLRFTGAMTTDEQATLVGLSTDTTFQTAVSNLFQQPVTFIQNTLGGFLDANAANNLARNTASLDQSLQPVLLDAGGSVTTDPTAAVTTAIAAKFAYLLSQLLPYLTTQSSHAFIKQTIADALQLDGAMAQLLLETVLKSRSDSTQPAIADLLALTTSGLTATYFPSNDLTGASTSGMDAAVAFDGILVNLPAGTHSARWSGMLLAPNNGDFTFAVRADGAVQLRVGDVALQLTLDATTNEMLSQPVPLKAGQLYTLALEVKGIGTPQPPQTSPAVELRWQSAAVPKAIIPADRLYPQNQLDAFRATFTLLQKSALLLNKLSLNAGQVAYLAAHPADFAGFDLNALPLTRDDTTDAEAVALFGTWRRLNAFATLQANLPQGEITLIDVFGASSAEDAQMKLAQASGWDPQLITGLAGVDGFNLAAADFKNEIWPVRLQEAVRLARRLGVSAQQLFSWASLNADFPALQTIAQAIKKTVQAKYDPDAWLVVAKALNDGLRERQRDALVAYLLPRMNLTDSNQLYEYFLIDADMGACMETSRVKQALSSVQLFVQRCLMNLESKLDSGTGGELGVAPAAIDAGQWEWMQHYRVWEANRKVFLYLENWIVPELRDDASPFFKELEGELLQNDITADNVETAFRNYLEKVDQVARLEICGLYWQDVDPDTGEPVNILHVFGRTWQQPHLYFYRQLVNNSRWTAWEKVPVDIQSDHMFPIILNRRLYIFWANFVSKADPPASTTISGGSVTLNPPRKHWEVQLAWSEYKQGKWSPKVVSKQVLTIKYAHELDEPSWAEFEDLTHLYFFRTDVRSAELLIHCIYDLSRTTRMHNVNPIIVGTFDLGGCTGDAVSVDQNRVPDQNPDIPQGAHIDAMMFSLGTDQNGLTMTGPDSQTPIPFLKNTPVPYELLYPHQYPVYTLQAPFFYQDVRTFFVTPNEAYTVLDQLAEPNRVNVTRYTQIVGSSAAALASGASSIVPPLSSGAVPGSHPTASTAEIQPASGLVSMASSPASGVASNVALELSTWASAVSASRYNWHVRRPIWGIPIPTTNLTFAPHYHSFVCEFMKSLARQGIPGLLTGENQSLGIPYLHSPWHLAFWGSVTAISEAASGPACIVQADFGVPGAPTNFEAVVLEGNNLVHYWRDNSDLSRPWQRAEVITTSATGAGWLIQSNMQTNGHGFLEVIVPEGQNLVHYWLDNTSSNRQWNKDALPISAQATGPGCLIQSDYIEVHGDLAVPLLQAIALEGSNLVRYWRDSLGDTPWHRAEVITSRATSPGCLIQSDYLSANSRHRMEVVVCEGGNLVHYYFDGTAWQFGEVITSKATGAACLIQGDIRDGAHGNFEVVVPEGNQLVHYWHDNSNPNSAWRQGQVITTRATGPACIIQSTFGKKPGTGSDTSLYYGNFEVAALEGQRLVHYRNTNDDRFEFGWVYQPTTNVNEPYPVEDVDFSYAGAYSLYNWELFFHAPLLIAERLSQNQRFADAQKWFHYIFNPTDDSPTEIPPARYWKVLPFKNSPAENIQEMMLALDNGDDDLKKQVNDWCHHPFLPHRLAQMRPSAYQKNVFMKYLDNLIAWGDHLFQQDTIEMINQAQQLYILAADLLGPRPQTLPDRGVVAPETYANLKGKLDAFSNALVALENEFPCSSGVSADPQSESGGLLGLGRTLYFGIPQNDKLLSYWDTVADRLFKIRHCMNIQGIVQRLPLFQPPIDPALLVQAAAQGVDLSSVINDINAPLPNYRFNYMLQKALEMCGECRSLGASLLSALEKKDAEALALKRATQESHILTLMEQVKQQQLDEANTQVAALQKGWDNAVARYSYYQMLLGNTSPGVPDIDSGTDVAFLPVPNEPPVNSGGNIQLLPEESAELDSSHAARDRQEDGSYTEMLASVLSAIPTIGTFAAPLGNGVKSEYGGQQLGAVTTAVARYLQLQSTKDTYEATHAGKMAVYFRRLQEWTQQSNLAAGEINQIAQQYAAAKIRAAIAQQELAVHQQQMQDAQDVQDFLTGKYTNQDLYSWMIADISTTYFQCYQMAYDLAKKAERTYRFERGLTDSNFIRFGYWDSLHKGLQSGERLYLDLKQLERAYQDQNRREYEITKHYSLLLSDPLALIALKETGRCEIELPEALFDADYPGHYMRRLKSVSLTIPCVVGPYTSINCTLTLLSNKTRVSNLAGSSYVEDVDNGDNRFVANFAPLQSIATSHAQNDSGVFELNFHDERYLPFEGAGAIARWRIDLPHDTNALDFNTLTDVVLHLKYTAREGGDILRNAAKKALKEMLADDQATQVARLFSLKNEFPTEWYRFLHPVDQAATSQTLTMSLGYERFPFLYRGKQLQISAVDLFLNFKDAASNTVYQGGAPLTLSLDDGNMPVSGALTSDPAILNGTPHASLALTDQVPVSLTLTAAEADVAQIASVLQQTVGTGSSAHQRLNADLIDDIFVVCHYTIL